MAATDPTNPLIEQLLEVLETVHVDDSQLANELSEIRSRLSAPLRVALVGRVSSGKSTLLNSLLGQIVAPTDAGECTEVATSFEYGFPERVEIRLNNGNIEQIRLDALGRLPERLPVPKDEVQDVRVWLANENLHTLTLVDTPGFSSGQAEVNANTDVDVLDRRTRQAAANCDAVVFVLNQTLRADDMDVLRAFQEGQPGSSSAVNAVGALTKADKLANGSADPLEKAEALAKRYSERHCRHLSEVVPVIGLWSETAESGALDEQDVAGLIRLAEMDGEALDRILASADRFRTSECPIDAEARGELPGQTGPVRDTAFNCTRRRGSPLRRVPQTRTVSGLGDRTFTIQRGPEVRWQGCSSPPSSGSRSSSLPLLQKGDADHVRAGTTRCG